jgi:hypothetical protein
MRRPYSFVLAIAAAIIVSSRGYAATATTSGGLPSPAAAWMPDVADRVASLRERLRRAEEEARDRQRADLRGGQWWRSAVVAAPPMKEQGR